MKRNMSSILLFGAFIIAPFFAMVCPAGQAPQAGELVLEDNFDRADIGSNWIMRGTWEIKDGALHGKDDAYIVCALPIGDNIRLEYDAWSTDGSPNDLTASLLVSRDMPIGAGYFFQFGGDHNQRTEVRKGSTKIGGREGFPIQPGRKHHVVCEKWGSLVRFIIDDTVIYSGLDISPKDVIDPGDALPRNTVALYIFTSGFFDNVRAYRLSGQPPPELLPVEKKLRVSRWFDFNKTNETALPQDITAITNPTASVRLGNFQDFTLAGSAPQTPKMVDDGCIELVKENETGSGYPAIQASFPELENGMIEVELLAQADEYYGPASFKIALYSSGTNAPALVLTTDAEGHFISPQAVGKQALPTQQKHPKHPVSAPLFFQANRWHRIRIHFDTEKKTWSAALVGVHFSDDIWGRFPHQTADWMPLCKEDLPLPPGTGNISRVVVSAAAPGTLCVDNLYVIGPWNGQQVNERDYRHPARVLLGSGEHPRHDPPRLKIFSTRSIQAGEKMTTYQMDGPLRSQFDEKYPVIMEAARLHGELLVRLAFLEERGRRILHALQYLEQSPDRQGIKGDADALLQRILEMEKELGKAHIRYAEAYLNGRDQERMRREFIPAAETLRAKVEHAEKDFNAWFKKCGADELALNLSSPGKSTNPRFSKDTQSFLRDGRRCFFFSHEGRPIWEWQHNLFGLDTCLPLYHHWFSGGKEGEWVNPDYFAANGLANKYYFDLYPDGQVMLDLFYGLHFIYSYPPKWWLEQNRDDADVFFHDEKGKSNLHEGKDGKVPYAKNGSAQLNYWNPKVQEMCRKQTTAVVELLKQKRPDRVAMVELMAEAHHTLVDFSTGHNVSAKAAFRRKMAGKYGKIEELNRIWKTQYTGFEAIEPPPDIVRTARARPSALAYEWELFRQEGYRDWMALITQVIRERLPGVPITTRRAGDTDVGGGYDVRNGFDLTMLYPLFDFFEFHFADIQGNHVSSRVIESLRQALGGAGGSTGESYIGCTGETFNQTWARRVGALYIFDLAAAGRSYINSWCAGAGGSYGWTQTSGWTDPRFGHTLINYASAGFESVVIRRLHALERFLLDVPLVAPKVNIFDSNASFLQGASTHWEMDRIANILETERWDYGFLWESLVLGGEQTLDGSEVIIIPRAHCIPVKVQQKLLEWTQNGGALIAVDYAPGKYDELGREDGALMAGLFGKEETKGLKIPYELKVPPKAGSERTGQFVMLGNIGDKANRDMLTRTLDNRAARFIQSDGRGFMFTIRSDKQHDLWHITVSNPDMLEDKEEEIRIAVPGVNVRDAELPGLQIPTVTKDNYTAFRLRLAPCESIALKVTN